MSSKITSEVWEWCPQSVGPYERLILLRMADVSNDEVRASWESLQTLAKRTGMSVRKVSYAIGKLQEHGILAANLRAEEMPPGAAGYASAVRRINPVNMWIELPNKAEPLHSVQTLHSVHTAQHAEVDAPEQAKELVTLHAVQRSKPITSSKELEANNRTTYNTGQARCEGSFPPPKAPSKSAAARAAAAADQDADPFQVIGDDTDPSPLPTKPRPMRKTKSGRSLTDSEQLARRFRLEANRNGQNIPGSTNDAALVGSFGKWMRDDKVPFAQITQMIEFYWSDKMAGMRSLTKPAWQDFLARRGYLSANRWETKPETSVSVESSWLARQAESATITGSTPNEEQI